MDSDSDGAILITDMDTAIHTTDGATQVGDIQDGATRDGDIQDGDTQHITETTLTTTEEEVQPRTTDLEDMQQEALLTTEETIVQETTLEETTLEEMVTPLTEIAILILIDVVEIIQISEEALLQTEEHTLALILQTEETALQDKLTAMIIQAEDQAAAMQHQLEVTTTPIVTLQDHTLLAHLVL